MAPATLGNIIKRYQTLARRRRRLSNAYSTDGWRSVAVANGVGRRPDVELHEPPRPFPLGMGIGPIETTVRHPPDPCRRVTPVLACRLMD
jgi:hypothetical protein